MHCDTSSATQNIRFYCQEKLQSQLSWPVLALVQFLQLPGRLSGLVVNKQEISTTCFVTFVGLIQKSSQKFEKLEDYLQVRQSQ